MDLGTTYWRLSNTGGPDGGDLFAIEGAGSNNSTAIMYSNRTSRYHGIGQHLDTRCIHLSSAGEYYEILIQIRLEENSVPFSCNIFTSDSETRCPSASLNLKRNINDRIQTQYKGGI